MPTEADLAKLEAVKRFRAAVRLELSIAGDYVIGRHIDQLKAMADREIASGGVPALNNGVGSMAKKVADALSAAFEDELTKLLELPSGE